MGSGETGHLVGGPHDGVQFPTNDRFWFTGTVICAGLPGAPPAVLSRYDLDPDDPAGSTGTPARGSSD